ncbi:MAG: primosome assembly protein PriA, partial [Actinomycetota bacterium]|nr:primosome assembly protein PriA [Actinomycetota bacterium]
MTAASAAAPPERAALIGAARRSARQARPRPVDPAAPVLPVARVAVDLPLAHLDRSFDYEVPASLSAAAQPGTRVRVRVAGRELDGFVLERSAGSDFAGSLQRLRRVVSPEPVLDAEVLQLARRVAERYAGTLADVLRLAVPPRVAKVEAEPVQVPQLLPPPAPEPGEWAAYSGGPEFLAALAGQAAPRVVWAALPGSDWAGALARAVQGALAAGRGALVVVPDGRDVAAVDAALTALLGSGWHVALTADLGPRERYRRWLALRRGAVRGAVGTRAAMFAPVRDLGLVVVWDDGDDALAEPRAPYPHAREVLCLRAHQSGAAALVGGYARTAEGELLLRTQWAHPLVAERPVVRAAAARVLPAGDDEELVRDAAAASARLPTLAWQVARDALGRGPVLVQVPRRGYLPALA